MTRAVRGILSVLAVVAIAGAAWVTMPVQSASACSLPGPYDPAADATSVVLGTVVFVGEMVILPPQTSKSDPVPQPNHDRMTPVRIEVSRTLLGAQQTDVIEAFAAIRDPENEGNLPCFPLEREAVLGAEAVIALRPASDGTMQFSGPQYWALDEPIEDRQSREILASVYNGTYPGVPAAGTGLSGNTQPVEREVILVAGWLLLLAAGATAFAAGQRRR